MKETPEVPRDDPKTWANVNDFGADPTGQENSAADWPDWRGRTRDGHSNRPAWPDKLGANHLERLCCVEIGPGPGFLSVPGTAGDGHLRKVARSID